MWFLLSLHTPSFSVLSDMMSTSQTFFHFTLLLIIVAYKQKTCTCSHYIFTFYLLGHPLFKNTQIMRVTFFVGLLAFFLACLLA